MDWLGLDLSGLGQAVVNMVMREMIFEMRGNFLPCLGELLSLQGLCFRELLIGLLVTDCKWWKKEYCAIRWREYSVKHYFGLWMQETLMVSQRNCENKRSERSLDLSQRFQGHSRTPPYERSLAFRPTRVNEWKYFLCKFSLWEVLAFFFRGGWVRNGAARWWNHCSHLIFLYGSLFCWQTKRWKFMLADWCLLGCDAVNISSLPYLHCKKKILNSWLLCWHHNCVLFKDPTTRNGIVTLVWNNSKYMCSCRPCVSKCSLFSDWWL